jgi:prepilin-type N-terminal cleavage/methylation domain-containing protein
MRRAFTLIELVVALGVLAIILSFAGVIFRVSIDAQRLAMANAEIMQKFRVITQQLDADFRGRIPQYGGNLSATNRTVTAGPNQVTVISSDAVAFLANGDFQSTNQYGVDPLTARTVVGNVAAVYYGHGQPDPNFYPPLAYFEPRERILLRRQTILVPQVSDVPTSTDPLAEYYSASLSQWHVNPPFVDAEDWTQRPVIQPAYVDRYQSMYLAEGVGDFAIHYLPSDADVSDLSTSWRRDVVADPDGQGQAERIQELRALRFTFTLYDSKGIIANGRRFTHIVPWSE